MDKTETVGGVLGSLKEIVDDAWTTIDADPVLDDDGRADMIRQFEAIEDAILEARKLIPVSSEDE